MTNNPLTVSQRAREAAAVRLERSVQAFGTTDHPALQTADWMREGKLDGHPWVQDYAAFESDILASISDKGEGEWQDIATAPKDGTLLELVVDYSNGDHALHDAIVACTVGFNSHDNTGVDEWKFAGWCWTHDHFVQGNGVVLAWRRSRLNAWDDALSPLPAPPMNGESAG